MYTYKKRSTRNTRHVPVCTMKQDKGEWALQFKHDDTANATHLEGYLRNLEAVTGGDLKPTRRRAPARLAIRSSRRLTYGAA